MTERYNPYEEKIFALLSSYFEKYGPAHYQLESFNHFINFGIQNVIIQEPPISYSPKQGQFYEASFSQISVGTPKFLKENRELIPLYPSDCREKNITYEAPIFYTVTETFKNENGEELVSINDKQILCKIPIMLRSEKCNLTNLSDSERIEKGECENDPGGYFIIKGKERCLIGQIRSLYNKVFVLEDKRKEKYLFTAEARSMSDETAHSVLIKAYLTADMNILFSLPYVKELIPVGYVFKALGFEEQDIISFIGLEHIPNTQLYTSKIINESKVITTQESARNYIAQFATNIPDPKDYEKVAKQIVEDEILPHMGISSTLKQKAVYLGAMIAKLILTAIEIRQPDDRDNYANKRVEISGILLIELFRTLYKRHISELKQSLEKKKQSPDIIKTLQRSKPIITKNILSAFGTGNWTATKNSSAYCRTGVAQVLDRMNYMSMISHLRRLVIPIGKEGKNIAIRQIHASQIGFICPAETPEGASAGINLNVAITAKFSNKSDPIIIREVLEKCEYIESIENICISDLCKYTKISLNDNFIGFTKQWKTVVQYIKEMRFRQRIDREVSVAYIPVENEIKLYSDDGRFLRPLFVLNNNVFEFPTIKLTWNSFVKHSKIVYLDPSEIESSVIAMYPSYTQLQHNDYCEIHPIAILGVLGAMIPFSDHSQSPRNCYQTNMGKQALGIPILSYPKRSDTLLYILQYPQKPLASTKIAKLLKCDEMPSGINAIVAIMTYTGFNQEDSIIINQSAIDRGLFGITQYKTIEEIEKKCDNYSSESICIPPESTSNLNPGQPGYFRRKHANYSMLSENGIIRKGMAIKKGDVLIGKIITKTNKNNEETKTDVSRVAQEDEEGVIDKIFSNVTPNGYKIIKIILRNIKIPIIGDKFASRAAQKGTVGMVYRQEDMPFNQDGITPDIIINPNCFTADTLVSLPNGLSRKIVDVKSNDRVLVYNGNGVISDTNVETNSFGVKEVIELTFQDGRTIECTPDHRFLVVKGDEKVWKRADKIQLDKDKIVMSVEGVEDIVYDDEKDWKLECSDYSFDMKTTENREKSLAFARILGFMLGDGTLCVAKTEKLKLISNVSIGHLHDIKNYQNDIHLVTGKRPKYRWCTDEKYGNVYVLSLPTCLTYFIYNLKGVEAGRRTHSSHTLPEFIFSSPKSIIREFLGGLFGADGQRPSFKKDAIDNLYYGKSSIPEMKDKLRTKIDSICTLLNLFNVEARFSRERVYETNTSKKKMISCELSIKNILNFAKNIGFRYCSEKSFRLSLLKSYLLLRENVCKQSQQIIDLIDRKRIKHITKVAIEKAQKTFRKHNAVLNEYYSLSTKTQYDNRKKKERSQDVVHLNYRFFPRFEEYLKDIDWRENKHFTKQNEEALPTFTLKVLRRVEIEDKEVYCLTVKHKLHNFIANGGIVLNCIPSRMTINQLIECLSGKIAALSGEFQDVTPFTNYSFNVADKVCEKLQEIGFESKYGWETLYSGFDGKMLSAKIFMGPTYYQRLKHLVSNKIHARARGQNTALTRQPLEGRSRDGGLRFGEMERDCMIAHGASAFLQERLCKVSDPFVAPVCMNKNCGAISCSMKQCQVCGNDIIEMVQIPYAAKLLVQELNAMGVKIIIHPKK